ncbi:Arylsulfotransferase-domain-containing protein [Xylariaceae sp. FL1272]|nr:Arylsulfotransferase-domain-containing protein [Xylariaceae sp. FL1272]
MYTISCAALLGLGATIATAQTTNSTTEWPHQTFKSEPGFRPPVWKTTRGAGTSADGYIFYAPVQVVNSPDPAPMIVTNDGDLVWHGPYAAGFAHSVWQYKGEPVLAYWNGTGFAEPLGRGYGYVILLDQSYNLVANVTLPGNYVTSEGETFETNIDNHEIYITNRGTVLVTANNVTQADLTSVGGPADGWVVDAQFHEIDIETNEILFSWSSVEHADSTVPITDSVYPLGTDGLTGQNQSTAWGYFHINAVAPFNDGYIISSRFMCSEFHISSQGEVVWRLGGIDGGDFTKGPDTDFCYQHDIRPVYSDIDTYAVPKIATLHLFDNENCQSNNGTTPTSGLILEIDTEKMHVERVARYMNPDKELYAVAQGSFQPLQGPGSHNNVFLGYGFIPYIQEFTSDGRSVQVIQFGEAVATPLSYRAFKEPWTGCPTTKPAVAVEKASGNETNVYVSWNGATDVASWKVLGGNTNGTLHVLKQVSSTGFETTITVPTTAEVQVQAVLKKGSVCKMSCGAGISSIVKV